MNLVLIVSLLALAAPTMAQRSKTSEMWHEVIRLRQQYQREKAEVMKARLRLQVLRNQLKSPKKEKTR